MQFVHLTTYNFSQIERPFTNNPVIPLLDCVYDHVIKRYPKRAFCILRNCVRVSDLLRSTEVSRTNTEGPKLSLFHQETVFELVRPPRAPSCPACSLEPGPRGRLRPKSQGARIALRSAPSCSCAQSCCTSLSTGSTSTGSTGPGSLAARTGNRPSSRAENHNEASSSASVTNGTSLSRVEETEGKFDGDQWVVGVPDKIEPGKSEELMSFLEHNEVKHQQRQN